MANPIGSIIWNFWNHIFCLNESLFFFLLVLLNVIKCACIIWFLWHLIINSLQSFSAEYWTVINSIFFNRLAILSVLKIARQKRRFWNIWLMECYWENSLVNQIWQATGELFYSDVSGFVGWVTLVAHYFCKIISAWWWWMRPMKERSQLIFYLD